MKIQEREKYPLDREDVLLRKGKGHFQGPGSASALFFSTIHSFVFCALSC
jgi:hypothetical protein